MDKTTGIIAIVAGLVIIGAGIYFMNQTPNTANVNSNATDTTTRNQNIVSPGRVVVSVTDAAANMANVSELVLKINGVELHSATTGWTTISSTPHTYSLLMLKNSGESNLLADTTIIQGSYDQMRLNLDSVSVKTTAGAIKVVVFPSKQMTINTILNVGANLTSSVNLDFLADKSLYTTATGAYVFAPVVKTEIRSNATLSINNMNTVTISSGTVDDTRTFGMDLDGSVKLNFNVGNSIKFDVDKNGVIIINGALIK